MAAYDNKSIFDIADGATQAPNDKPAGAPGETTQAETETTAAVAENPADYAEALPGPIDPDADGRVEETPELTGAQKNAGRRAYTGWLGVESKGNSSVSAITPKDSGPSEIVYDARGGETPLSINADNSNVDSVAGKDEGKSGVVTYVKQPDEDDTWYLEDETMPDESKALDVATARKQSSRRQAEAIKHGWDSATVAKVYGIDPKQAWRMLKWPVEAIEAWVNGEEIQEIGDKVYFGKERIPAIEILNDDDRLKELGLVDSQGNLDDDAVTYYRRHPKAWKGMVERGEVPVELHDFRVSQQAERVRKSPQKYGLGDEEVKWLNETDNWHALVSGKKSSEEINRAFNEWRDSKRDAELMGLLEDGEKLKRMDSLTDDDVEYFRAHPDDYMMYMKGGADPETYQGVIDRINANRKEKDIERLKGDKNFPADERKFLDAVDGWARYYDAVLNKDFSAINEEYRKWRVDNMPADQKKVSGVADTRKVNTGASSKVAKSTRGPAAAPNDKPADAATQAVAVSGGGGSVPAGAQPAAGTERSGDDQGMVVDNRPGLSGDDVFGREKSLFDIASKFGDVAVGSIGQGAVAGSEADNPGEMNQDYASKVVRNLQEIQLLQGNFGESVTLNKAGVEAMGRVAEIAARYSKMSSDDVEKELMGLSAGTEAAPNDWVSTTTGEIFDSSHFGGKKHNIPWENLMAAYVAKKANIATASLRIPSRYRAGSEAEDGGAVSEQLNEVVVMPSGVKSAVKSAISSDEVVLQNRISENWREAARLKAAARRSLELYNDVEADYKAGKISRQDFEYYREEFMKDVAENRARLAKISEDAGKDYYQASILGSRLAPFAAGLKRFVGQAGKEEAMGSFYGGMTFQAGEYINEVGKRRNELLAKDPVLANVVAGGQGMIPPKGYKGLSKEEREEFDKVDKAYREARAAYNYLWQATEQYKDAAAAANGGVFAKLKGVWDGLKNPDTWTMGASMMERAQALRDADVNTEAGRRLIMAKNMADEILVGAPNPGYIYEGGYFVGGMVGDPITYVSLGVGKGAEAAAKWGLSKLAARGVEKKIAGRLVQQSLTNRVLIAGASSAGNLAAFEGLGELRGQLVEGGWYDDDNKFHEGLNWGRVWGATGRGGSLGAVMGAFGGAVGLWGDVLVRRYPGVNASRAAIKTGIRAGQHAVSFVGEGTIFAAPEILSFMTMDDEKFDEFYAKDFGYDKITDKAQRDAAREEARGTLSMEAWTQSQAYLIGMKVGGTLTHPRAKIGYVANTLHELRRQGERDHVTFAEKVSRMMSRSQFDVYLTDDELSELRRNGYGSLGELFIKRDNGPTDRVVEVDEAVNKKAGTSITTYSLESDGVRPGQEKHGEEFDGYKMMGQLMGDRRVSQSVRAKCYFILTGKMLPMSTVVGHTVSRTPDGEYIVNATTIDGEVVTSRRYSSERAANEEVERIVREGELNSVNIGEQYAPVAVMCNVLGDVVRRLSEDSTMSERGLMELYHRYRSGGEVSESEMRWVREIEHGMEKVLPEYEHLMPEGLRKAVKERWGVDVDEVLRKLPEKRSEREADALHDYVVRLFRITGEVATREGFGYDFRDGTKHLPGDSNVATDAREEDPVGPSGTGARRRERVPEPERPEKAPIADPGDDIKLPDGWEEDLKKQERYAQISNRSDIEAGIADAEKYSHSDDAQIALYWKRRLDIYNNELRRREEGGFVAGYKDYGSDRASSFTDWGLKTNIDELYAQHQSGVLDDYGRGKLAALLEEQERRNGNGGGGTPPGGGETPPSTPPEGPQAPKEPRAPKEPTAPRPPKAPAAPRPPRAPKGEAPRPPKAPTQPEGGTPPAQSNGPQSPKEGPTAPKGGGNKPGGVRKHDAVRVPVKGSEGETQDGTVSSVDDATGDVYVWTAAPVNDSSERPKVEGMPGYITPFKSGELSSLRPEDNGEGRGDDGETTPPTPPTTPPAAPGDKPATPPKEGPRSPRGSGERPAQRGATRGEVYDAAKGMVSSSGLEVVEVDDAQASAMLLSRGDARLMGSRDDRKMKQVSDYYAGKDLDENQRRVVDVFAGAADNLPIEIERADGKRRVVMRQGRSNKAGTKHALFRHFGTRENFYTIDEIAMIPEAIAEGVRSVEGNKVAYDYVTNDGTRLRVTTEKHGAQERFTNFLSNRKPPQEKRAENTQLSAPRSDAEVTPAKVGNSAETAKSSEKKGGVRYLLDGEGRVYGWTVGGKVYLNRDAMNPEAPLHEYTHLWDEMVRRENPELWERGKELLKQTDEWEKVMNDPAYADIRDNEDAVASEVHSRLTGKDGARILEEMISGAKGDGVLETARKVTLVDSIKRWLSDMFAALKKTLSNWSREELNALSLEDFNNMALRDLAEGVNPVEEMRKGGEEDLVGSVDQTPTNVNGEGMIVDAEGKPLTLYHGTPNDVELADLEMGHTRAGGDETARYNGDGISFTPNRDVADDYASQNGGKGKVFEVNVTLKKPYYTLGVANFTPEEAAAFTSSLQARGYDGIINYQSKAMREAGANPNEVIVFDIKSVNPVESSKGKSNTPISPNWGHSEQFSAELAERYDWNNPNKRPISDFVGAEITLDSPYHGRSKIRVSEIISGYGGDQLVVEWIEGGETKSVMKDPLGMLADLQKRNASIKWRDTEQLPVDTGSGEELKEDLVGKVGRVIRDRWAGARKEYGFEDEIVLPDGSTISGRWVLVEAGSATASHDVSNGFKPSEGFPTDEHGQSVNDRDYEHDRSAQEAVYSMARDYDQRAMQSPVVVSKDGVVLSGNNRSMSGDEAARSNTDGKYVEYAGRYGRKYGFSQEQVEGFSHPRVHFEVSEDLPYTAATFARFNAQETKKMSYTEAAVKMGKMVSDRTLSLILRDMNECERMSDYFSDSNATKQAVQLLMADGIINERDLPSIYDAGKLSDAGKRMVEQALLGKVFEGDGDSIRRLDAFPTLKESVFAALIDISRNHALGVDYSLQKELSEAIRLCYDAKTADPVRFKEGAVVASHALQSEMFGEETGSAPRRMTPIVVLLANLLNDKRSRKLKEVISRYNESAKNAASGQADIFSGGVESKDEIVENLVRDYEKGLSKDQLREYEQWKRSGAGGPSGASEPAAEYGGARPEEAAAPSGRDGGVDGGTSIQNSISEKKEIVRVDPRSMTNDEKARRGDMLRNATAIEVAVGQIVATQGLSARKAAEQWWDDNVGGPKFYETEAGEVEISKSSVKDSLSHGYNQGKLDALTSLSEGFHNATYLGTLPDFGRPGVMNHYFAYPIFYDGQRRYVFCRAMATNNKNRLYIHEVFLEEAINKSNTLQTIASASKDGELHGGIALYKAILRNVLNGDATLLNKVASDGKVTNSASDKQENGEESSGNVVREASLFDYNNEDERARRQQQGARQLSLFGDEHREEVGGEHQVQRERQMSLFDRDFSEEAESDIDGAASRLDERLDEYAEKLSELLTVPEELRTDEMEEAVAGIRDALMGDLVDYYESKGNDRGEARERARDMIVHLQAQATIAEARRRKLLSEETEGDADGETATPPTTPGDRPADASMTPGDKPADASKGGLRVAADGEVEQTHVTAGGEELSFYHTGWLPKLGDGHFTLMERQFVEDGSVPMSGATRIESADDVAYMMRAMETLGVEHTYAVLVKDGRSTVVHLGMGVSNAAMANKSALKAADMAVGGADEIYFVHNHPSGNLEASPQDAKLLASLEGMFPGRVRKGIIMDGRRGLYSEFDNAGRVEEHARPQAVRGEEQPVTVRRFDAVVYSEDYDYDSLTKIKGPEDVAQLVSGMRLGKSEKVGVLILNQANQVVGNLPCSHRVGDEGLADELVRFAVMGGGNGVIIYGTYDSNDSAVRSLGNEVQRVSGGEVRFLDSVRVKPVEREVEEKDSSSGDERKSIVETAVKVASDTEKPEDRDKPVGQNKEKPGKTGNPSSAQVRRAVPQTIEDFGEHISGARKDMLRDLSDKLSKVDVKTLVAKPFGQVVKRPDFTKMTERGEMSPDEALTAEALWQAVYSHRKPTATRGNNSKIVSWAELTASRLKALNDFISGDVDYRRSVMQSIGEAKFPKRETEQQKYDMIHGSRIDGQQSAPPAFTPDASWVSSEVLKALGGDSSKRKIEFRIVPNGTYEYYYIKDAGGHPVHGIYPGRDLNSAVDGVVTLMRLREGDSEVVLPESCFSTRGNNPIMEDSGQYEVLSMGKGLNISSKIFSDEASAKEYAANLEKKGRYTKIRAVQRRSGKCESYSIVYTHPESGERVILDRKYDDLSTAKSEITNNREELSRQAHTAYAAMKGVKSGNKSHFEVNLTYDRNGRHYSVCFNGRGYKLQPTDNPVVKSFATREEAEKWLSDNAERLEKGYADWQKARREFVFFEQKGDDSRLGEDYRGGKDVTPEQFSEAFGFRGVQFGNWTNQADRQAALNEAYDAFMDLSRVIGVSPRALSLGGELGVAFGSRGSGNANAHYEPDQVVINLTKTRGAGSLAHEWWHALDNYLMRQQGSAMLYSTEHGKGALREGLSGAIVGLVESMRGSNYHKRSLQHANPDYWGSVIEESARLFAEWVVARMKREGGRNRFLSHGIEESAIEKWQRMTYNAYKTRFELEGDDEGVMPFEQWEQRGESLVGFPYPTMFELEKLSPYVERIFEELQEKEGEDGEMRLGEEEAEYTAVGGGLKSDGERLKAIESLKPIHVERNDLSREELKGIYKSLPIVTKDGHQIEFYRGAFKKIYKEGGLFGQVIPVLNKVLDNSVLAYTEADNLGGTIRPDGTEHKEHKNVLRFENYVGKVKIDDTPYFVRTTVQHEIGQAGTHSFFVSNVNVYENPTESRTIPITSRGTTDFDGIVDAKLQQFFERASSELREKRDTSDESSIRHRLIDDGERELLDFLEGQPTRSGFRYAQWANMGVLPPMTAKKDGQWRAPMVFDRWEQSEEGMRRKANGKVDLNQGNGSTTGNVAYNPYFHIRTSPLNDQFTAAYRRPELIVVEGEYPESELTSGYRADGAKDPVGLLNWHAGGVNGQLAEGTKVQTMLSRYFKPGRIVPWSEVADRIMDTISGQDVTFPINVVPPMLRYELARRGVKFGPISGSVAEKDIPMLNDLIERINGGEYDAGLEGVTDYVDAYNSSPEAKERRVGELSQKLGVPVRVISDPSEIASLPWRMRHAKGWWDGKKGEIVIVLPNNINVADVENTAVHEMVGHEGLRLLVGEENMDSFLDEVYGHASRRIKRDIDAITGRMVEREAERIAAEEGFAAEHGGAMLGKIAARARAEEKREQYRREATEEYMSDMAGRIGDKGFEEMHRDEQSLWGKIKQRIQEFLDRFLQKLKIPKDWVLSDDHLRYILYRSWKNLRDRGSVLDKAEDIVMRQETGWDEEMQRDGAPSEMRFRDGDDLADDFLETALRAAKREGASRDIRDAAMDALGKRVGSIAKSMRVQRRYDRETLKSVSRMARELVGSKLLDETSSAEVGKILTAVGNGLTGREGIEKSVHRLLELVTKNQERVYKQRLDNLIKKKGYKTNAYGVKVQDGYDATGQAELETFGKYRDMSEDAIAEYRAELEDKVSHGSASEAELATARLRALDLVEYYQMKMRDSEADELAMERELETLQNELDGLTDREERKSKREEIRSMQDALLYERLNRAQVLRDVYHTLSGDMLESRERVKEWREKEQMRVANIHHIANADMQGIPAFAHGEVKDKFWNNWGVRFFMAPTATFEQMMRMFGSRSSDGRGYLFNHFVRGWQECADRRWVSHQAKLNTLDAKAQEILGGGKKRWSSLYKLTGRKGGVLTWKDGNQDRVFEVTQGNLMYIYMADKMVDGAMKLRAMGITEDNVAEIEERLDPRLRELADWIQEEFLPSIREEYNEVHIRMFGAPMDAIEDYFPLKILKNALHKEREVGVDEHDVKPKTMTEAWIKRRVNRSALDILNADPVSIVLEHLEKMEDAKAFSEYNRDLGTLLSYNRFQRQVKQMRTPYGSGEVLWRKFNKLCQLVGGALEPKTDEFEKAYLNTMKLVTASCIAARLFTAFKQTLSFPAFAADAGWGRLAINAVRPKYCFKWAMENLPSFEKRWRSRQAGNEILRDWSGDWDWTNSKFARTLSRLGMSPNAFVDAVTISVGAEAVYHRRYKDYVKDGLSQEEAHRRAVIDAEICFNLSQQSSELPYISLMQNSRTIGTTAFTLFRNSSMSYQRQDIQALRQVKNHVKYGKDEMVEYEAKKYERDGFSESGARRRAEREYNRTIAKSALRLGIFALVLPGLWALGTSSMIYLLLGKDDDKKREMLEDGAMRSVLGGFEGLSGGGTMPDLFHSLFMDYVLDRGDSMKASEETSPGMGMVVDIWNAFAGKRTEKGISQVVNALVTFGTGVNPQLLEDIAISAVDLFNQDEKDMLDYTMFMLSLISAPKSQVDALYLDQVDMTVEEARKRTPRELAARYKWRKVMQQQPMMLLAYDQERFDELGKVHEQKVTTLLKENLAKGEDAEMLSRKEQYEESARVVKKTVADLKEQIRRHQITPKEGGRRIAALMKTNDAGAKARFSSKRIAHPMEAKLIENWLTAETPEDAVKWREAIIEHRRAYVYTLDNWRDKENRSKGIDRLVKLYKDYRMDRYGVRDDE